MPIDPVRSSYIGVFLENILYGFYLAVFLESCIILARKQKSRNLKQMFVLGTAIALFIFITLRCAIDIAQCIYNIQDGVLVLDALNNTRGVITNLCWCIATLIADMFIIFRTFIVWKKNYWITLLPFLLLLANTGVVIWSMYSFVSFNPATDVFSQITITIDIFLYLTLFTNVLCTGLISYKIFNVRRNVAGVMSGSGNNHSDGVTSRIITIIVESAAVYTLLLVAQLIANSVRSYVTYLLIDMTPPTIGLVFSYIIIRVSRGSSYGDSSGRVDTSLSRDRGNFELSGTRGGRSGVRSEVQVRLERVTVQHSDREIGSEVGSKDELETRSNKYGDATVV
ncbi:hypothetical protein DFH08DRAFT_1053893 [Mycena albidolilacea]|uniref:Uncharacterized protein n=1 Tax=Mycena albidolilacea TaxID=1033008 RepID=A0AAD6Z4P7_9AGAR|nr:hypothetical protein DFH08DRAFT_1053893 [Mycena albidolilacea]